MGGDRATAEDGAWLRGAYPKITNSRIRERIASAIGRMGGEANNQWLMTLAKNQDEPLTARMSALRRISQDMDIATIAKFYDSVSERPLRETLIRNLADRKEPEAVDKLIDIVKNSTDPDIRRTAISALADKKDPRATKLLLDLVNNKPTSNE